MKIWIAVSLVTALSCSVMASQGQFEISTPTHASETANH